MRYIFLRLIAVALVLCLIFDSSLAQAVGLTTVLRQNNQMSGILGQEAFAARLTQFFVKNRLNETPAIHVARLRRAQTRWQRSARRWRLKHQEWIVIFVLCSCAGLAIPFLLFASRSVRLYGGSLVGLLTIGYAIVTAQFALGRVIAQKRKTGLSLKALTRARDTARERMIYTPMEINPQMYEEIAHAIEENDINKVNEVFNAYIPAGPWADYKKLNEQLFERRWDWIYFAGGLMLSLGGLLAMPHVTADLGYSPIYGLGKTAATLIALVSIGHLLTNARTPSRPWRVLIGALSGVGLAALWLPGAESWILQKAHWWLIGILTAGAWGWRYGLVAGKALLIAGGPVLPLRGLAGAA